MTEELLKIIQSDIARCVKAQHDANGSFELYQALVGKYSSKFNDFAKNIPQMGKAAVTGEFDYRSELKAIMEKLEFIIATEAESDPLWNFKKMYEQDLQNLLSAKSDINNEETPEIAKQQLYKEITAKYHTIIPKLGFGLYQYIDQMGFYDDVTEDSLFHNLEQLFNKLTTFKAIDFPNVIAQPVVPQTQINNYNENTAKASSKVNINITIDQAIEAIHRLPQDVLSNEDKEKLEDEMRVLDSLKNSGKKGKIWDRAKTVLAFLADKGADAMIAAAPYIINTLQNMP